MTLDLALLSESAVDVAPQLLGASLSRRSDEGNVVVRVTEVEAYVGDGVDPGSHAFRGRTKRNASMYGPPGHLYTYFTYGMHVCANVVCSPAGHASAVLLRAGEIVEGAELAARRRGAGVKPRDLARGPARLVVALGILLSDGGAPLDQPPFQLTLPPHPIDPALIASGPRTGVSGSGGSDAFPWRFWIAGDPTVSPYKPHVPKKR